MRFAVENDNTDYKSFYYLGKSYELIGNPDRSEWYFKKAISAAEKFPDSEEAKTIKADASYEVGEIDEAIRSYSGKGGVNGSDGINPIDLIIGVGTSDREWLEPLFASKESQFGIKAMIPNPDSYSNTIIDACIAFAPSLFNKCGLLKQVSDELGGITKLDFTNKDSIPSSWDALRFQAKPVFEKISVFESPINEIRGREKFPNFY